MKFLNVKVNVIERTIMKTIFPTERERRYCFGIPNERINTWRYHSTLNHHAIYEESDVDDTVVTVISRSGSGSTADNKAMYH